jgi:hypothetical protein
MMTTARAILVMMAAASVFRLGPARAAEQVLVPQLSGWKAVDHHVAQGIESDSLIPGGETEEDWTHRLTVQAFRGTPMTAVEFLDALVDRVDEVCDSIAVEPIIPGPAGPYESARRVIACGR